MKPGSPSPGSEMVVSTPEHWSLERLKEEIAKGKPRKYRNEPCWSDGYSLMTVEEYRFYLDHEGDPEGWKWFPSKKEGRRWVELNELQERGEIRDLERQKSYRLEVNGLMITTYRCDSRYIESNVPVVEDTKGMKTEAYKIKKKLMKAIYGIEVRET